MNDSNPTYIPGVCNIDKSGVAFRKIVGFIGLLATLGFGAAFILLNLDPILRLTLFFPAFSSALGFLQARQHFCVNYGMMGIFKVGKAPEQSGNVQDVENRRKDRQTSLRIIGQSVLIGVVVGVGAYFLPV